MQIVRVTRTACVLLAAITLVVSACGGPEPADQAQSIRAAELVERVRAGSAPLVLDVRTRREFARGHIPGAVNIPYEELADHLGELDADKNTEVVVYCEVGQRAAFAEDVLVRAGYTNVRDLEGHMRAWRGAGYPTR